jgi:hypothetical protein
MNVIFKEDISFKLKRVINALTTILSYILMRDDDPLGFKHVTI